MRIRIFSIQVAVISSFIMVAIVLAMAYLVADQFIMRQTEKTARALANSTYSCIYEIMMRGLSRQQLHYEMTHHCELGHDRHKTIPGSYHVRFHYRNKEPSEKKTPENYSLGSEILGKGGDLLDKPDLEEPVREVFKTANKLFILKGSRAISFYPLKADKDCITCHRVPENQVLGVVDIRSDMSGEISRFRSEFFMLLLLIIPVPFLIAVIAARVMERRIKKAVRQVQERFIETDPGGMTCSAQDPELDFYFGEFNALYNSLVDKLDKSLQALITESLMLRKLFPAPGAYRNWKKEATRILTELNQDFPLDALVFVFCEQKDMLRAEAFWQIEPLRDARNAFETVVKEKLDSAGLTAKLTFAYVVANHDIGEGEFCRQAGGIQLMSSRITTDKRTDN